MADGIDLREFRKLTRDLKAFKPDKQVKKALRMAGTLIAEDAKAEVGAYSRTVPPSVKVRIRKTSVSVIAGGAGVPMGGLLEEGNAAGSHTGPTFKHPVFAPKDSHGDQSVKWVDQPMHPYLLPAAARKEPEFEVAITACLDEAVKTIVFG